MFPAEPGGAGSAKLKHLLDSRCSSLAVKSDKPAPPKADSTAVGTALRELWSAAEAQPTPQPLLDLIDRLETVAAAPAPKETRSFD